MKIITSKKVSLVTAVALVGILAFLGLSFKSNDSSGQVMTVMSLLSKSAMKGDQDLCLIVDGNIIERIELPSAFSTKVEDKVTTVTMVNKTLNRLSKEGWKIVTSEGYLMFTMVK
jgi:hypothetical protein